MRHTYTPTTSYSVLANTGCNLQPPTGGGAGAPVEVAPHRDPGRAQGLTDYACRVILHVLHPYFMSK